MRVYFANVKWVSMVVMGVCEEGVDRVGDRTVTQSLRQRPFYDRLLQIKGNERFLVILGSFLAGFY